MQASELAAAGRMTLGEYFERVHRPLFLAGASPRTLAEYRATLRHWERSAEDAPIAEITSLGLAAFRAALLNPESRRAAIASGGQMLFGWEAVASARARLSRKPRRRIGSAATANKHLTHIQAILDKAGPPSPGRRDALGVIAAVPWLQRLRVPRRLPRDVEDRHLAAIYGACAAALHPALPGIDPEHWWQAMIVAALLTGFRREALLALRWSDIDLGRRLVRVEAESDKCDVARVKPLAGLVVQHLVRIRTADPRVFPWRASAKTWDRQWQRLNRAAGLVGRVRLRFHDLKRACGTRIAAAGYGAHAVKHMLDHASLSTSEWYVNATSAAMDLRGLVDRIPLPPELSAGF